MAFCCGTRLARVECLQKEGWGHPIPRFSRAKPAAAAIRRRSHHRCQPWRHIHTVIPKAAGVFRAPSAAAHPSDAHAAQVCFALGSPPVMLRCNVPRTPRKSSLLSCPAPQPPCHSLPERASFLAPGRQSGRPLRPRAEWPCRPACGRRGIRFSRPVARRALRQFAASSALARCRFC